MNQKTARLFEDIQSIPTVPFATKPIENFIEGKLTSYKRKFTNNKYSIICNYPSKLNSPKLIIMCHTDHPGVVMKNSTQGVLFGTPGIARLKKRLKDNGGICYKVYSPSGKLIGKTKLVKIKADNKTGVFTSDTKIPVNSLAQYDEFPYFKQDKQKVFAYNADDGISVAVALSIISEQLESDFDVYWVFNLYEEVHQISAWNLAKYNYLNIKNTDFILNLECQKVENVNPEKYPSANYNSGIILQLSNTGCLFGYKSKGENFSETLIKQAAKKANINLQIGIIKDSCDSRPLSYFDLTPNIATLNIPNKFKHNENEDGDLVPEEIKKKDIEDFYEIIKTCLNISHKTVKNSKTINLSRKLKEIDNITNKELMKEKSQLNDRLEIAYSHIIKRKRFYPQTLTEKALDFYSKVRFYFKYFFQFL